MIGRTFQRSWHCGEVRYSAAMDRTDTGAPRNCSIRVKLRFWQVFFKARFQITTPDAPRLS